MEKAFLKEKVQKYLSEHELQIFLTNCMNEIIQELPKNPYKYIIEYMEKDLEKKILIKKIKIKKYINKNFCEKIKAIFEIETNIINKKFEINLDFPFLKNDLKNLKNFFKKKNEEIFEDEKIFEIERRLKDFFENQNIYNYDNFENLIERFYENDKNMNFKDIMLNFSFFHFKINFELRKINFSNYLKENRFYLQNKKNDYEKKIFIKIFQNGKNLGTKNMFFENIYIVLNKYKKKNISKKNEEKNFIYEKNNFFSDLKKGYNFLYEYYIKNNKIENILQNGSFLPISENLKENLKLVNDFISKFIDKEEIKICIDFNSNLLFCEKNEKYDFGGKFINDEEIENIIFKLISENKKIEYILDPFEITRNFSYHKFYKKIQEKKIFLKIGSKFFENFNLEKFQKLDQENFPKLKNEQFDEFCQDLFNFDFFVIDLKKKFLFSKIFEDLKFFKKYDYEFFFMNFDFSEIDFLSNLSDEVGGTIMGALFDQCIRNNLE